MKRALLLVALLAAVGSAWSADLYRGRPLGEVLREFREGGLPLVYSSAIVDSGTPVPIEPAAEAPREALAEILAAVGLRTEPGPGQVLLIVAGAADDALRLGAAVGYRTEIRVVPGEREVDDGSTAAARRVGRDDVLTVPAIGGDAGRVVEKLPGVVAPDNSAAWSVRGSLPGDVSLVVDGLELYDPYHLREFQAPFTLIDPRLIDRIDLLPGGFTVEYGDRHGAIVAIETSNRAERLSGEFEIGTLNSRAALRAPLRDGSGAWLVSARGWYPEAVVDSLGLGGGERLRPRMGDLFAKWTRASRSGTIWALHGLLSYDRISFQESGEDDNESVDAISRHGNVWARATRLLSPKLRSETVVSVGRIRNRRDGVASPDDEPFVVRDHRDLSYLGAAQQFVWAAREGRRLRLGVSGRFLDGSYRYDALSGGGAPDRRAALDPRGWQWALYAAQRNRLSPRVAVEVGLRWDRQQITDDDHLAPRAHLIWTPADRTEVRFAAGRFVQSQRVHELSIADGETTFSQAEISDHLDGMLRWRSPSGLSLRVDLYRRRIDRPRTRWENLFSPVELFPETADDRVSLSPASVRLEGLELTAQGAPSRRWRWFASYALTSAEDRIDGRHVPRVLDQTHTVKGLIAWTGRPRWTLALAATAHSGRPYTTATASQVPLPGGGVDVEFNPGPRNAERLSTYARLDLKLSYRLPARRGAWIWTADILNVTDRDNACCVGDFFAGPAVAGTIPVDIEFEKWLGFVPTFSIRREF